LQVAFEVSGEGSKSILADSTVAIGGVRKRQGNSSMLELATGSTSLYTIMIRGFMGFHDKMCQRYNKDN